MSHNPEVVERAITAVLNQRQTEGGRQAMVDQISSLYQTDPNGWNANVREFARMARNIDGLPELNITNDRSGKITSLQLGNSREDLMSSGAYGQSRTAADQHYGQMEPVSYNGDQRYGQMQPPGPRYEDGRYPPPYPAPRYGEGARPEYAPAYQPDPRYSYEPNYQPARRFAPEQSYDPMPALAGTMLTAAVFGSMIGRGYSGRPYYSHYHQPYMHRPRYGWC